MCRHVCTINGVLSALSICAFILCGAECVVKPLLLMQVPPADNYFAALNSAVFTDGSFVYIPKGVNCPMELSTYFRINAEETGQVHSLCHKSYWLA